ncbi:MAG: tetratricopeptide repeat protein [Myxococcales bacterium]|nr:tetratricopeptide repeat protein [Myxococcales bacterium]HIK84088.1 tetratricopeptide repeat protein [Myxococcales bacterium]
MSGAGLSFRIGLLVAVIDVVVACSPEPVGMPGIRGMHEEGRYAETLELLASLLDESPDDLALNHLYGVALLATGNSGMAVWPLRKAAEAADDGVEDRLLLAAALLRSTSSEDGIVALGQVLALEPDNIEALIKRAGANLEQNKHEEVLADAERVLALVPSNMRATLWRLKSLADLDRIDEAKIALEETVESLSTSKASRALEPRLCGMAAELEEADGDDDAALHKWEECLEEFPGAEMLVTEAVRLFDKRGDHDRSEAQLRKAIEARPRKLSFRKALAARLVEQERLKEAEQLLLDAATTEEKAPAAWMALADYYRSRDDAAASARATEQALHQMDSVLPVVLGQYADDLIQAGEFARANEVIAELDTPRLVNLLEGRMLLAKGDPASALEKLEAGLQLWPGNPTARWLAGRAAEELGDFDRAISEYRNSVRAGASQTDAAIRLAHIHEAEGALGDALFVLSSRIRANPDDVDAYLSMIRLGRLGGPPGTSRDALKALSRLPGQEVTSLVTAAALQAGVGGAAAAVKVIERGELDLNAPENFRALAAMVEHLASAGRLDEGLTRVLTALEAHSDSAEFHHIHGRALRASAKPADQIKVAFERALELEPEHSQALADLARAVAEEGRVEEALALYDRAILADDNDSSSAWAAVQLLDEKDEREPRLIALLDAHPLHAKAATLLAEILVEQNGDLERAEQLANRAVRFGGGREARDIQARVALARGE